MPSPSKNFLATLQLMDASLSLRWGDTISQWVVERKGIIGADELHYLAKREARLKGWVNDPTRPKKEMERQTWMGVKEEFESAKRGMRVIIFAPELTPKIFDMLALSDLQRYGGYSRYADEMEKIEAERDARVEREMSNKRIALNAEVFDMMNFMERKKLTELIHGERNIGLLLHGKRSNGPLVKLQDF